jgi:hypothetical protein
MKNNIFFIQSFFFNSSAMFAQTPPEKFRSSLFKGSQGLGAAPRVATRKWRNSPCRSKRAGEVNWVAKATQEENPPARRGSPYWCTDTLYSTNGEHLIRLVPRHLPHGGRLKNTPFRLHKPTDKAKFEIQPRHRGMQKQISSNKHRRLPAGASPLARRGFSARGVPTKIWNINRTYQ